MKIVKITTVILFVLLSPFLVQAQGLAGQIGGLHAVLEKVYEEMIPLCSGLIAVARGIWINHTKLTPAHQFKMTPSARAK